MNDVAVAAVKRAILLGILLTACAYMTLLERRLLGEFQIRYGPNRVGPFGLLQPLADGGKLILKENFMPANVGVLVYWVVPALSMITALFVYAVIPFGPEVTLFGRPVALRF